MNKNHDEKGRFTTGPSNAAAIAGLHDALRAGVSAHSAGIHSIARNFDEARERERAAAAQQTIGKIKATPGGSGTEDEWAEIKYQHYKEATK